MLGWLAVVCFFIAAALAAVYFAMGIKIKQGWQHGTSPLARWLDARRRAKFDEQLPQTLSTMSNALRAGFSLSQAFESVVETGEVPVSEEFAILQQQLRIGMSFEDALESMSSRVGSEDFSLVATAILISRRTGGNVTEIFDKISDTIRERMKIERKVRSLTSQGRLQGIVVSLMPFVLLVAMTAMKPKLMLPFLTSMIGVGACGLMIVLIVAGWLMIRKIVKIDV